MASLPSALIGRIGTTVDRGWKLSALAGALAIAVGGTAVLGWWLELEAPGSVALGLLVILALLAVAIWQGTRSARRTERDRMAALEERDRFFDVSKDLLVTASGAGSFVRLNPAWTTVLGYDVDELCSRPLWTSE